jgi:PTS system nitrogen regulatory IIA component
VQLKDLLRAEAIVVDVAAGTKVQALRSLGDLLAGGADQLDPGTVAAALLVRERLGSTAVGRGVAFPHARCAVERPVLAFVRLAQGVDFEALDGHAIDHLAGLLVPHDAQDEHLRILARLAAMFGDSGFRQRLAGASSSGEYLAILRAQDERMNDEDDHR